MTALSHNEVTSSAWLTVSEAVTLEREGQYCLVSWEYPGSLHGKGKSLIVLYEWIWEQQQETSGWGSDHNSKIKELGIIQLTKGESRKKLFFFSLKDCYFFLESGPYVEAPLFMQEAAVRTIDMNMMWWEMIGQGLSYVLKCLSESGMLELPQWSVVKTLHFQCGLQVRSLVWELRCHILCSLTKGKKRGRKKRKRK